MEVSSEAEVVQGLDIDTAVAELVLTGFLREEIPKAGVQRAVVGLSAGLDSLLSCLLAARALGPENVTAVHMYCGSSVPRSLPRSRSVLVGLGVGVELVDISAAADALFETSHGLSPQRKDDLVARLRMTILYDRAVAHKALVVGTSNKTRILLGTGTIFGDLASAVNPIGDLYKTQVRQLSRSMGQPVADFEPADNSDLITGLGSEGDPRFTYTLVDRLLYLIVDERYSQGEAEAAGFDRGFVTKVMSLIRCSQYKRALPVIPKISGRTVGHDFRYLRDWGA